MGAVDTGVAGAGFSGPGSIVGRGGGDDMAVLVPAGTVGCGVRGGMGAACASPDDPRERAPSQ